MADSELLCVRATTLCRQTCKHTKSDVIEQYKICPDFVNFIVLDICLALSSAQAKNISIVLAITLVRTRANPMLICDVNCRGLLYDCGM